MDANEYDDVNLGCDGELITGGNSCRKVMNSGKTCILD